MFEQYILGKITLDQLVDWVNDQITLIIEEEMRKEEVDLDFN